MTAREILEHMAVQILVARPVEDASPAYRGSLEHWTKPVTRDGLPGWVLFLTDGPAADQEATCGFALRLLLGRVPHAPWQQESYADGATCRWVSISDPTDSWADDFLTSEALAVLASGADR